MNLSRQSQSLALHSIAMLEIAKGVLAVVAAAGFLSLKHTDLNAVAHTFIQRHGLDPGRHATGMLIESVARATSHHTGQIAGVCLLYALVRFVEGYGLWRARHWAEWFAALSTGIYLPLEIRHYIHRPSALAVAIILVNLGILGFLSFLLFQQRQGRDQVARQP
jgi:uncharacterized membrane protein (DUF2068 family)